MVGQTASPDLQEGPSAEVEGALLDALTEEGTSDFVVVMAEQADLSAALDMDDWSARGHYVYDTLRQAAARIQTPVLQYAEKHGLAYHSSLSANVVFIEAGSLRAAQELVALPGVALVRLPTVAYIQPTGTLGSPSPDAYGWNLDILDPGSSQYGIQAARVWDNYGVKGEGIVVANIDTGAFFQHEALDRQYRGNLTGNIGGPYDHNYNWYMPTSGCGDGTYPCDNNGHGSGTIGIMAGETANLAEQIGVAPAAQWIACKGCETGSCTELALTRCMDWMVAPCPIGVDPGDPLCDPDKRPHIVNNSWGGPGCRTIYQSYIQAWVAAGIFPAFSAGNTAACEALGSPGDNPLAFGTAAHGSTGGNLYAGGPSCFFQNPSCNPSAHQVDPHLNAPTYGRTADNYQRGYYNLGGTSGASPHTAGTVALVWSAHPSYVGQIDQTFTLLEQSANHNVPPGTCGKPICAGANVYPNYQYGWGYLDALAAVEMAGNSPPSTGTFAPNGSSGTVLQWALFTTTYTDPNGYDDIEWAFFLLDGAEPIGSGALAAAYYRPANLLLLIGDPGGFCQPGQPGLFPYTEYVAISCEYTTVSGAGDALTINWAAVPIQCFEGGCGWNYAIELVGDSAGLQDAGVVGYWRLDPVSGPARDARPAVKPTEADVSGELDEVLDQLMEEIKAWR
jgi:subtilisin family serine protease